MIGTLIQRMIWWDLVKVFLVALLAITGLLLLAGAFSEANQRGLEPMQILGVIPLLIPSTLPYTLPTTTLFATCVVYGRLAADNEILALRAAGVHLCRIVGPGIVLGLMVSGATAALYYYTIPASHYALRNFILEDVEEFLYAMLRRHNCIQHPRLNYTFWVQRVEGRKLIDAHFYRRDGKGKIDVTVHAREAQLRVVLAQNVVEVHMWDCHVAREGESNVSIAEHQRWDVDLPPELSSTAKNRENDLTWEELFAYRDKLQEDLAKVDAEINAHQVQVNLHTAPDNFPQHVKDLRYQKRTLEQQIRYMETEMHMRPALAFGCLCFVLIGCPVGIWFSRSDYLSAFITCFLPIVFIYYPLLLCGTNIARGGHFSIPFLVWSADGLMGLSAAFLFRKLLSN